MLTKILTAFFAVLCFLIIGEAIYYSYLTITPNQKIVPTIVPTPVPNMKCDNIIKEKAIRNRVIKEGTLIWSQRVDIFEAPLVSVKKNTKSLIIEIKQGTKTQKFYYEEPYISRIKVFKSVNGKEKAIDINDLKPGDKISMRLTFDELKPDDDIIDMKITKL